MTTKEKILMIQLLLEDIFDGYDDGAEERASKAESLCKEVEKELDNEDYGILADYCTVYIKSSKKWDDWDGRFFRQPFPMGYMNMKKSHGLKPTYKDKSEKFRSIADEYLMYPENRFNDWEVI